MKKYQGLGELLKDYRIYHSISQAELAAHFDVDIRSVSRWKKNESLLSTDKEEAWLILHSSRIKSSDI